MCAMQDLGELDGLNEYVEKRTKDKEEIIEELREENKRYKQKAKMQDHIIDTQQEIIRAFCELVGMINDKV